MASKAYSKGIKVRALVPVKSGWMPPWMQTSVAPRFQASAARRAISASGSR